MLEVARSLETNSQFICADGAQLPLRSGYLDLMLYSMSIHHLGHIGSSFEEARRCLRIGGAICVRTSTTDRLHEFAYLGYFPSALKIDQNRMPSAACLRNALTNANFAVARHEVIVQRAADTVAEYLAFIEMRSLSDLLAISDREFQAGFAAMRQDAEKGLALSLNEPIDFFVAYAA